MLRQDDLGTPKPDLTSLADPALNQETPPHLLRAPLTPTSLFFVRNNGTLPTLPRGTGQDWRLDVTGLVERPLSLSLAELRARFPVVEVNRPDRSTRRRLGKDDAIEFFGGTVNVKYIYSIATEDDGFDWTFGWDGKAQFVVAQHNSIDSDNGLEADNATTDYNALPRATPTLYNFTFVGPRNNRVGSNENQNRGLLVRRGARPTMRNFHVEGFSTALDFRDAVTCTSFQTATFFTIQNSTFALNGADGPTTAGPCGAATTIITSNNNQKLTASPLLEPLSWKTPDFRPSASAVVTGATPPSDGFFDVSATYVGAVAPALSNKNNAPWYAGWVRGWQSVTVP
jgi:hypothetical protein